MRRRLWFSSFAVAVIAVLVVGVPALVIGAGRGAVAVAVIVALMVAAAGLAAGLTAILARWLARPVEELAEAAARLGAGDPRPLGRRYGVADLDQVADGLDTSARRLSSLLAADRELAVDASHQLRTPLTALSMRLEEMIAAADDPDVVREEGQRGAHPGRAPGRRGDPAAQPGPAGDRGFGGPDRDRRDRSAAGRRVGAGLPPGAAQARGDRRARPGGSRHPRRAGPGARHAAG